AFAEADYRTLLIDGDVRRGMLHRTIGVPRRPGLTDVLADGVPLEQAVRTTRYESLAFFGCGARTRRAPELLGSAGMVRLLTSRRPRSGGCCAAPSEPGRETERSFA